MAGCYPPTGQSTVIRVPSGHGRQCVEPTLPCPGVGGLPKALAYVLSVPQIETVFWQDEWDNLFVDDYDGPIVLA
jgi:hypothetical protein